MDLADLLEWPTRADVPGMLFRRLISRHSLVGIDRMTRAEQVLWLVFELCGEVSNGGVDQFFANSSGDRGPLVPAALRDLGHPALASSFEKVAAPFSGDRVERVELLRDVKGEQREAFERLENEINDATPPLLLELCGWIAARSGDFHLANAGLGAFRPVEIPPDLRLDEIFEEGISPEEGLPALYIRWAARPVESLSSDERALQVALHAFGEISDEGPVSYFFCRRGNDALAARDALKRMGANEAAKVMDQALALFPFSDQLLDRRARLAKLDADTRAALGKLQWTMDDLRGPTTDALFAFARAQRASLK
ncbi:MAG: DUF4375 domain-containing protein [Archangium sp.]|nr:DUF4375 domain-containing protein [Archangium sp.]